MNHEATVRAVAAVLRSEFDALSAEKCERIARKALKFAREDGDTSRASVECIARELAYEAELDSLAYGDDIAGSDFDRHDGSYLSDAAVDFYR